MEEKGVSNAVILGATGKRDYHSLTNIFILLQHSSPLEIILYTNYGIFSVVQEKQAFDSFTGQQISIFSADSNIEVTSKNLKYNLHIMNYQYAIIILLTIDYSFYHLF